MHALAPGTRLSDSVDAVQVTLSQRSFYETNSLVFGPLCEAVPLRRVGFVLEGNI